MTADDLHLPTLEDKLRGSLYLTREQLHLLVGEQALRNMADRREDLPALKGQLLSNFQNVNYSWGRQAHPPSDPIPSLRGKVRIKVPRMASLHEPPDMLFP